MSLSAISGAEGQTNQACAVALIVISTSNVARLAATGGIWQSGDSFKADMPAGITSQKKNVKRTCDEL
jgi:hypothetical protein